MTRSRTFRWGLIIALLLISWGLRLVRLEEVPPGWRDDELINIHALSSQVLDGQFPLYYTGASGHEPLYHHLHAGVHAALGFNVLSGHILSVMFGTLSVALTYSLARRLFPRERITAVVASLTLATSFWSLIYSRTAIRHISLPPFALAIIYVFWRQMEAEEATLGGWTLTGLLLGTSLYTYTASRLLPLLIVGFAAYLLFLHPDLFRKHRKGLVLALVLTALLVAPLGIVIARNRSRRAIEGIGADARVTELAGPLRALQDGDPGPVIGSTVKTLGMFHASGDPEWLYNIPNRPVFNLLGGMLLWIGVTLCIYRWRTPSYSFLLLWLALGLSPAFISTPSASLGHTILAQPVAYILPAVALTEIAHVARTRSPSTGQSSLTFFGSRALILLFIVTNTVRDLRSYFGVWPHEEMVQILYRADYRRTASYTDAHPEFTDLAVTSTLLGPWDRLALAVDTERESVNFRLFDPGRALVWTEGQGASPVVLTTWPRPDPQIRGLLDSLSVSSETLASGLRLHSLSGGNLLGTRFSEVCAPGSTDDSNDRHQYRFDNGLELTTACWLNGAAVGSESEMILLTAWTVVAPLDLPEMPIVANPPPPGTYAGPRLAVFAHLLPPDASSTGLEQSNRQSIEDDGLWVDPLTLSPGDRFIQIHRFDTDRTAATGPYTVRLGLYDPMTGERRAVLGPVGNPVADHIIVGRDEQP